MEKVALDDVEASPNPLADHEDRRPLSRALETDHVAVNYFELEPGETFSGGLHAHDDQEELFLVSRGTAAFEVGRDRETVTVGPGEAIRFEPGEFQTGGAPADADETVVAWAIGAPGASHDWAALDSVVYCRACETERVHDMERTDDGVLFACTECENSFSV